MVRTDWFGYVFGSVGVVLVAAAIELARPWSDSSRGRPTLYLIVVLATAALYGRGPTLVTAAVAFVTFELWLVGPDLVPEEPLRLAPFLVAALVTGQMAAALRRRAEEARRREGEAVALYEVVRLVPGSTLELQPLLGQILDRLGALVPYRAAEIIALEGDEPVVIAYRGPLPRERVVGRRLPREGALRRLVDEVVRGRGPVVIADLAGPSLLTRDLAAAGVPLPPDTDRTDRTGSELSVPLIVKGEVIPRQPPTPL
jgi:hypothetical protein